MAAVAPAADQAASLLETLSLDSQNTAHIVSEVSKKPSVVQHGSFNGREIHSTTPSERLLTPSVQDVMGPNMCYRPNGYAPTTYYYGGYDGSVNNGMEMPLHGVYGDMYGQGYGYAYGAYPCSQVLPIGHDGQMYSSQNYHYPTQFYQPLMTSSTTYALHHATKGEDPTSVSSDQPTQFLDTGKANSNGIANGNANGNDGSVPLRSSNQNSTLTANGSYGRGAFSRGHPSSGYQDLRFGLSSALAHNNQNPSSRNHTHSRPHPMGSKATSLMGPSPGYMNRMYPNNQMHRQHGNMDKTFLGYGSSIYDPRLSAHLSLVMDSKYKPKGQGSGFYGYWNENLGGLSELSRGPRGGDHLKNQKGYSPVADAVKGHNLTSNASNDSSLGAPDTDLYNRLDFPDRYSNAMFFVIKSYSEDDIHKSIKYSVWASTPNGNKKLDAAYQEAREKSDGCPVFLFFSVNTSGHFVGVAEMVGHVDFRKTMDYWHQNKWVGCFPVKWHIVKDVPNSILKHITIKNNDNKPVTNSRDTQEVKLEEGLQILKLFKEHVSKTSVLDDFGFYENRQKLMQEKRAKQQLQKQVLDEEENNGKAKPPQPLEPVTILSKAVQSSLGEWKLSEENSLAAVAGENPKAATLAT